MAYQAIYRSYRPVTFDKVIGQQPIVKTLTNQVKSGQIGHAYLFTGTRGTGKTSTARIFAFAVNCLASADGSPCGKCKNCVALKEANLDIIEIDAASNNGVEEIRNLRDNVSFLPSVGKYKVYIIDEVHMLSAAAFNALLKTLEEPPAHVVFILGTTEVHKVPATILSRCMRFDFKLVPVEQLETLIEQILKDNKRKFAKEAVRAIAVAGEGSVRDALTILDRCIAYQEDTLKYEDVLHILGAADKAKIFELSGSIFKNDTAGILSSVNDIALSGKSISMLARDMASHMRDLLVCKTCKEPQKILALPQDVFEKMSAQSAEAPASKLLYALEQFIKIEAELRSSITPRITFEVTALKVAASDGGLDTEKLEQRIRELERRGVAPVKSAAEPSAPQKDAAAGRRVWAAVLAAVRKSDSVMLSKACEDITNVYVMDKEFIVEADDAQYSFLSQKHNIDMIRDAVKDINGLLFNLVRSEKQNIPINKSVEELQNLFGKDNIKIER